jgi:alditol oxidase
MTIGSNWAGLHEYRAGTLHSPQTVDELRALVSESTAVRALGTRHAFNNLADGPGDLVSLANLPADITVDAASSTASVPAGLRYGDVATALQAQGWALHNLASLPHISIAGAIATSTHGSGDRNGTLATAVAALELVTASGDLVTVRSGDPDFDGTVVSLGALGIVTRVTLDIQPSFEVRQDLYSGLPWSAVLEHFDDVSSSAYSVSLFTNWLGDDISLAWLKSRMDGPEPPVSPFGAVRYTTEQHMIPGASPEATTPQLGAPGPWNDRLAHFKLAFTPSSGEEIQTEYLVPRRRIVEALAAVRSIRERVAPLLQITEIRTMAADQLWLSGAFETDAVGVHFTWKKLPAEVAALLPSIEELLLPLDARPHWGKWFAAQAIDLEPLYSRLADFRALAGRLDPAGKFRNEFLADRIGLR